ncbi:hypothetical protein C2125_10270 [Rahnella aquatilis]|nr:hypothetical protein [Rahnella aquatilis]RBQ34387.1 hypothetical protein C2125_10270 [Rahnella aquatilis]
MFGKKHLKSPDADKVKALKKWDARNKKRQLLIHTVSAAYGASPLMTQPAREVFKTWDIISSSFIDVDAVLKGFRLGAGLTVRSQSGLFFEAGFILDVPVQNILGTFSGDVWFPNHAGVNNNMVYDRFALADNIFAGRSKKKEIIAPGGYNQIQPPEKILKNTNYQWHNEILLIGRPDINTYQGLPPTREIKIAGIFVAPKTIRPDQMATREINEKLYRLVDRMKRCNPGVPVIDISR